MKIVVTAMDHVCPSPAPETLRARAGRGEIVKLYPGAYLDPGDTDPDQIGAETLHAARVFAAYRMCGPAVVSGPSAAVLHGLPVLKRRLDRVMVTRRGHGKATPWLQVRRSALSDGEIVTRYGIRMTDVQRTIRDLAEYVEPQELLAAADMARRQGVALDGLTSGMRNVRALRWVVEQATDRAESYAESWSRALLLEYNLPFPWQQVTVYDEHGTQLARTDFGSPAGVLGEVDGDQKYGRLLKPGQTARQAVIAEKRRENALRDLGWEIVRWDWRTLNDPALLARRLRNAHERALALPPPRGWTALEPMPRVMPPDWSALFGRAP